jgi:hypothetical protein
MSANGYLLAEVGPDEEILSGIIYDNFLIGTIYTEPPEEPPPPPPPPPPPEPPPEEPGDDGDKKPEKPHDPEIPPDEGGGDGEDVPFTPPIVPITWPRQSPADYLYRIKNT